MSPNTQGALFALAAFSLFASHDAVIKTLGASYSPLQIMFYSTLLSFPLMTFMLIGDNTKANLRPVHPIWTALRTFCAVCGGICAFYAFSVLPLSQTYAILFTLPLLVTVFSIPILGERVGWRRWMAVMFGLLGVLVVLRPGQTEISSGHAAALAAAIFSAIASVIVRRIGRQERSIVLLLYPMILSFLAMALFQPWVYRAMPIEDLAAVAMISVLGFCAGLLMIAAYRRGQAAIVAPMQYSQIVWATLFGAVFFDELPDSLTLLGAAIVIASGLYIVIRETRAPSSQTPVLRTRARGYGASFRISPFLARTPEANRSDNKGD